MRSRLASTARMISGRRAVHDRDPVRDLGLQLRRQPGQDQRGLVGRHVGQDQRDHLRVLVRDERAQLAGVGAVQELERHLHRGGLEPSDDLGGPVGAERLLEQVLGEGEAALGDVLAGGRHVVELGEDRLGLGRGDDVEPGDLGGDRLDLGLGEVAAAPRRPCRGRAGSA